MTYLQFTQKNKTQKKTKLFKIDLHLIICYMNLCIMLYSLKAVMMECNFNFFLVFFGINIRFL